MSDGELAGRGNEIDEVERREVETGLATRELDYVISSFRQLATGG